jgi:hypothetical protein
MIIPVAKIQVRRDEDGVWIAKSKLLPGCHAHGKHPSGSHRHHSKPILPDRLITFCRARIGT